MKKFCLAMAIFGYIMVAICITFIVFSIVCHIDNLLTLISVIENTITFSIVATLFLCRSKQDY